LATKEVKKHIGAVHIKGTMTFLQRKIANILLANAYEDLLTEEKHRIRIRDLAEVAGFDSNNYEFLKGALRSLTKLSVEWNVLDEGGKNDWGIAPFLAGARIYKGICSYSYSPFLREQLYHPEIYARINLGIQREFSSGHALALYENCVRFRGVGTTGWIDLQQWRVLLGIEDDQHTSFKYFNRDVLKPAIREINSTSDILLKVEFKKEKRRILALKFTLQDNPQLSLKLDDHPRTPRYTVVKEDEDEKGRGKADPLYERLLSFGLSEAQASKIIDQYHAERIVGNLDRIEEQLEIGKVITNIPGYAIKAIEDDYRPRAIEVGKAVDRRKAQAVAERDAEEKARRRREEEEKREAIARAEQFDAVYASLPGERREEIEREVIERMKTQVQFVYGRFERERREGKTIEQMSIIIRSTFLGLRNELLETGEKRLLPDVLKQTITG